MEVENHLFVKENGRAMESNSMLSESEGTLDCKEWIIFLDAPVSAEVGAYKDPWFVHHPRLQQEQFLETTSSEWDGF